MNLMKAKVCLDCTDHTEIYEGESCPKCGSSCYWWLNKFTKIQEFDKYKKSNRRIKDASA